MPAIPMPDAAGIELNFVAWLLTGAVQADAQSAARAHDAQLDTRQQRALSHLDHSIAEDSSCKRLLHRSAGVVPKLLARLRSDASTPAELTQYVSRDVILVAEVIRMANSPVYRRHEAVVGLSHALRLLGVDGLRRAVARAVLQPLIDVRGSEFVTRCAQRLWQNSDPKAQLCAVLAGSQGLDPFDGYLLGLVHNAAWAAVVRGLDSAEVDTRWQVDSAFVAALGVRRDRLFAVIAQRWELSDELQGAATEVAKDGLGAATSNRAHVLRVGDQLASLIRDPAAADIADALVADCAGPVRDCYVALAEEARSIRSQSL